MKTAKTATKGDRTATATATEARPTPEQIAQTADRFIRLSMKHARLVRRSRQEDGDPPDFALIEEAAAFHIAAGRLDYLLDRSSWKLRSLESQLIDMLRAIATEPEGEPLAASGGTIFTRDFFSFGGYTFAAYEGESCWDLLVLDNRVAAGQSEKGK